MNDPEPEREYYFVRNTGDGVEKATYQRYSDGSAIVERKGSATIYECDPEAWRAAWDDVHRDGFVEVQIARHEGTS